MSEPSNIDDTKANDRDLPSEADDEKVLPAEECLEQTSFDNDSPDTTKLFDNNISKADDPVIEKLTYGVLAHFLPDLQKAKGTLAQLTENQRIQIETVQQENAKFGECQAMTEVTETMEKAKLYHTKLLNIKREMHLLHEKSAKLKRRAVRLQQQKQKEALQQEQRRERELERERQLIAKPAKKT